MDFGLDLNLDLDLDLDSLLNCTLKELDEIVRNILTVHFKSVHSIKNNHFHVFVYELLTCQV